MRRERVDVFFGEPRVASLSCGKLGMQNGTRVDSLRICRQVDVPYRLSIPLVSIIGGSGIREIAWDRLAPSLANGPRAPRYGIHPDGSPNGPSIGRMLGKSDSALSRTLLALRRDRCARRFIITTVLLSRTARRRERYTASVT